MGRLTCPKCGEYSEDKDFNENKEKCSVWTDNNGNQNCECWECGCEWIQDLAGVISVDGRKF